MPVKEIINFNLKRSTAWSGDFQVLLEDISYNLSKKGKVVILAGEIKAAKVLERELRDKGIPVIFSENRDVAFDGVTVCCGGLSGGFEIPSCRFLLITHRHIASDPKRKRAKY